MQLDPGRGLLFSYLRLCFCMILLRLQSQKKAFIAQLIHESIDLFLIWQLLRGKASHWVHDTLSQFLVNKVNMLNLDAASSWWIICHCLIFDIVLHLKLISWLDTSTFEGREIRSTDFCIVLLYLNKSRRISVSLQRLIKIVDAVSTDWSPFHD